MQYLIFENNDKAKVRSFQIAIEQGCSDDVTMFWFLVINKPQGIESALQIPDGEEDKLTIQEQNELVSQEYMDVNGWFPSRPQILNS